MGVLFLLFFLYVCKGMNEPVYVFLFHLAANSVLFISSVNQLKIILKSFNTYLSILLFFYIFLSFFLYYIQFFKTACIRFGRSYLRNIIPNIPRAFDVV